MWMIFINVKLSKGRQAQKRYILHDSLYKVQRQAKLISGTKKSREWLSLGRWVMMGRKKYLSWGF